MEDKALENAVEKIYLAIADSGTVTPGQMMILRLYQDRNKTDIFEELTKFIDKMFPTGGNG